METEHKAQIVVACVVIFALSAALWVVIEQDDTGSIRFSSSQFFIAVGVLVCMGMLTMLGRLLPGYGEMIGRISISVGWLLCTGLSIYLSYWIGSGVLACMGILVVGMWLSGYGEMFGVLALGVAWIFLTGLAMYFFYWFGYESTGSPNPRGYVMRPVIYKSIEEWKLAAAWQCALFPLVTSVTILAAISQTRDRGSR